ncbi:MAG TPA: NAD(P)-dependent oxidoreductase, partial [bacterium]|nr:NAD(P)-dependent oxidoreductase [bacterium]
KGLFYETEPDIVFHLAAFTNVDGSEQNPIIAFKTNVGGTNNIAIMAERLNSYIVYISTDFVFDGRKKFPYTEDDIAFPVSVYGKTKLEGEQIIKDVCKQYCIVRTSKVFGKNGRNFASVLPEKLKRKEKIAITTDLVNSPTYAKDLAVALCKIVEKRFNGLLNFCNKGWCNWYEFGMYICRYYNFDTSLLIPISVNNFHDSIAPRPCFSALDTSLFARNFFQPRPWQLALEEFLKTEFFV